MALTSQLVQYIFMFQKALSKQSDSAKKKVSFGSWKNH